MTKSQSTPVPAKRPTNTDKNVSNYFNVVNVLSIEIFHIYLCSSKCQSVKKSTIKNISFLSLSFTKNIYYFVLLSLLKSEIPTK